MNRDAPPRRSDYVYFRRIPTRWMDNDVYGHVNNVIYYSWFDTAVNAWLIENGLLDLEKSEIVGIVVATECAYHKEFTFPQIVEAGLRIDRLGNSSVTHGVGLFHEDDDDPAATGTFVHVYTERATRKPVPIPEDVRAMMETLKVGD